MTDHSAANPILKVKELCFAYDSKPILNNLNLEITGPEIFCIVGSSGCGKSTLLRILAGLTQPGSGTVKFKKTNSKVGFVFQNYALFPHLSVAKNIAYGLDGQSPRDISQRLVELAEQFEITELMDKFPSEISGGQAQRVAIARSLAPKPDLLLLDEPFSNLDAMQKAKLKPELLGRLRRANVPTILVTHDQEEAFDIGDRIAVMHEGRFVQIGPTYHIYHEPSCRFVADFVGTGAFIKTKLSDDRTQLSSALGQMPAPRDLPPEDDQDEWELFLRPEDLVHDDTAGYLEAIVVSRQFRGAHSIFKLKLETGEEVYSLAPSHHLHRAGDKFKVRVELDHVLLFPKKA